MYRLFQVIAPHFCAGLEVEDEIVVRAAPIVRWAQGKTWRYCKSYFQRKGYKIRQVKEGNVNELHSKSK